MISDANSNYQSCNGAFKYSGYVIFDPMQISKHIYYYYLSSIIKAALPCAVCLSVINYTT